MKTEKRNCDTLATEREVLTAVRKKSGFLMLYYYGRHEGKPILILERLGMDLNRVQSDMGTRIFASHVSHAAVEMISRLRTLHDAGYVHGDVQPRNIMISNNSLDTESVVNLVDFGLSREIAKITDKSSGTKRHRHFEGTLDFSSARSMKGYAPSPLDDLESLGYVLMFLYFPKLPWSSIKNRSNGDALGKIHHMKANMQTSQMCKALPSCIETYMRDVQSIDFRKRPCYDSLLHHFSS